MGSDGPGGGDSSRVGVAVGWFVNEHEITLLGWGSVREGVGGDRTCFVVFKKLNLGSIQRTELRFIRDWLWRQSLEGWGSGIAQGGGWWCWAYVCDV